MTMDDPDLSRAHDAIKRQQFAEASELLIRSLATHPESLQARWLFVQCLESQGKFDAALQQLQRLLEQAGKRLPAIDQIAAHMHRGPYSLAAVLQAYRDFLNDQPESATAAFNLAWYLAKDGQFDAAARYYERSLELGIDAAEEVHLNIATICMDHLLDYATARTHLQKALSLNPAYASAHYNLGNLEERAGHRSAARTHFEKALELDPGNLSALARVADTHRFSSKEEPLFMKLVGLAKHSDNVDVHFALGRAREQLQDFESAWASFTNANTLDSRNLPTYDRQRTAMAFEAIMKQSDREWLKRFDGESPETLFICGMFRSGSTLLEQMLASHPSFVAGGESEFFPRLVARQLPAYPQELARLGGDRLREWRQQHAEQSRALFGESARVTDKRPDNFLYLGLIKAVLPSAKFIITERDWRDVATSIYSVRLGTGQAYATELADIRHYIDLQEQLVQHWAALLGPDLKRVRYEDLVRRPQETLSELLSWLGESWDERCLDFHQLHNEVSTASVWQVREPLHERSIGRWKHYERHFIEEFGNDADA